MNPVNSRDKVTCRKCGKETETFLGVYPVRWSCWEAEAYGWECGRTLTIDDDHETQKAGGQPDKC